MDLTTIQPLAIALILGLLVGLQREHQAEKLAGLRTFPLITVLGTLAALVDRNFAASGWMVATGFLGVVAVIVISLWSQSRDRDFDPGITTEIAILLMYLVGAYLLDGERLVAIAIGAGVAVLLEFKPELHGFVARLRDKDVRAIIQFALITGIILPALPNQTFGPFDVFNPFEAWLMVVLIVGISLVGYLLYKFFGHAAGTILGGLLGGAVSSTATTVSFARRTRDNADASPAAALAVTLAACVVYVRVLVEMAVVSRSLLRAALAPVLVLMAATLVMAGLAWWRAREPAEGALETSNPSELRSALLFAGMYTIVLFALSAAQHYLGGRGLYLVAGLSGLADLDAITLSTARMVESGDDGRQLDVDTAWRLVVLALASNLTFKTGMVAVLGNPRLTRLTLVNFGVPVLVALALMIFWP